MQRPDDMPWRPHVTVATVVARDGRFLMIEERSRGRLVLNQPAGHLEPGESLPQAAVREALEETAWDIRLTAFLGTFLWQVPGGAHYLRFAFAGEALRQHEGRALDDGIERALWLEPEAIAAEPARLRSPLVLASLDAWRTGPHLPLDSVRDLNGRSGPG